MLVCESILVCSENVRRIVIIGLDFLVELVETCTRIILLKVGTRIPSIREVGSPAGVPVLVEPVGEVRND